MKLNRRKKEKKRGHPSSSPTEAEGATQSNWPARPKWPDELSRWKSSGRWGRRRRNPVV